MNEELNLRGATRRFVEGVVKPREVASPSTNARVGTVTTISPFTVGVGGGTVQVAKLDSYLPTVGDRVLLLSSGGDLVCLGSIS